MDASSSLDVGNKDANRNANRTAVVISKIRETFFLVDMGNDSILFGNWWIEKCIPGAIHYAEFTFCTIISDPIVVMTIIKWQVCDIGMNRGYPCTRAKFLCDAQTMQTVIANSGLHSHGRVQGESVARRDGMAGKTFLS